MSTIISQSSGISYYLRDFWTEIGDPRTGQLPFMSSFHLPLSIFCAYLLFALYLGPKLMESRRPFSLKGPLLLYNMAMAVTNLIFFFKIIIVTHYGRRLLEVDWKARDDWSPQAMSDINWTWSYVLTKYIDLLDTVFFVLRKKNSQITG